MEAFHYRHHPMVKRIRETVDKELEGKVKHIHIQLKAPKFDGRGIGYNYKLSGGALMDAGCYVVNFARYIFGEEPEVVSATSSIAYPNVDKTTIATLKTASGKTAVIECSLFSFLKINFDMIGENGVTVHATNWLVPQYIYNKITITKADRTIVTETFPKNISTYGCQLKVFVEAVQKKR